MTPTRPPLFALLLMLACAPAPDAAPAAAAGTVEKPVADAKPPTQKRSQLLDPASFDTRCAKDDDCMGFETAACRKCGCTDAAIAASDREKLAAAIAELGCEDGEQRQCRCVSLQPWCDAGKCAMRQPQEPPPPEEQHAKPTAAQSVDLKKYDLSCKRDEDCTNVRPSPCGKCGCDSTPLREADRERFYQERAKIVCERKPDPHPGISCGGCPGYTGVCKQGKCAIETR
jgi:hypothetical protein